MARFHRGYVRTTAGRYYVQLPDDSQWGFSLHDDDQSWAGGWGIATEWTRIPRARVPATVRARLDWILDKDDEGVRDA